MITVTDTTQPSDEYDMRYVLSPDDDYFGDFGDMEMVFMDDRVKLTRVGEYGETYFEMSVDDVQSFIDQERNAEDVRFINKLGFHSEFVMDREVVTPVCVFDQDLAEKMLEICAEYQRLRASLTDFLKLLGY